MNPTRMHIFTHLSPEYQAMRNSENTWGIEEAGMKQMDDCIGAVIQNLKDLGVYDNTIIVFTTDNGTETFTWPDGGFTPFHDAKGSIYEGGFRAPAIVRWPGVVSRGTVINGIFSGLDWFPTLAIAAGAPEDIVDQLKTGMTINGTEYKVHLDGYNQIDLLKGTGPSAAARDLVLRQRDARRGPARQLQVLLRDPGRGHRGLHRPDPPRRGARHRQPQDRPVRADA